MPPSRPTARCCRAVQQQIRAPLDGVWITDGVLAGAFDRYCHVSRLARRKSSSLPGPLEGRRRLGKRKMTDLHMDNGATLPPWAIEFPIDLSQWKWQPPTRRSSSEKRDLQSPDGQSVLSWISKWRMTKKTELSETSEEAIEQTDEENRTSTTTADTLTERLSQARSAVAASAPVAIESTFNNLMVELQRDLKLGVLDTEAVVEAVSTFPPSLIDTAVNRDVADAAIEMFLSAVVNGITSSTVLGPTEFDSSFWDQILGQISQLQANDATTLLFQTTLHAVPLQCVNDVHEGLVAAVQALVLSGSTGRRRAADIGVALRELSPGIHGALLGRMEAAVYKGLADFQEEARQMLRFLWLQILAHMPLVGQDYLFDACVRSAYFDRELLGPVGRDLCQLLIQQWTSRGYLQRHIALQACCDRDYGLRAKSILAALPVNMLTLRAESVMSVTLLMSLFKALRRFGREEELLASIRSFCEAKRTLHLAPFMHLALASRNHQTALGIFTIMESYEGRLYDSIESQWHWAKWTQYVQDMIKDDSIPTAAIWRLVDLGTEGGKLRGRQAVQLRKRRKELLENMAVWFGQAGRLTDRAALRNVSYCIDRLRLLRPQEELSSKVIIVVISVVTRELKRFEPGRTARIEWALSLVEQHQGRAKRREVAQILQRWRQINIESGKAAPRAMGRLEYQGSR